MPSFYTKLYKLYNTDIIRSCLSLSIFNTTHCGLFPYYTVKTFPWIKAYLWEKQERKKEKEECEYFKCN